MKEDKFDKPSRLDRIILSILKKRKAKKAAKNKPFKTARTKAVYDVGKKNFQTDLAAELAKIRKKGQGK